MQISTLVKFKKNVKLIRLSKLYSDLLKTKHILYFFMGGIKRKQLYKLYKVMSQRSLFLDFLIKLEFRLELILVKIGFVISGKQAKQLILHGHVFVNNLPVKFCNFKLKLDDLITLSKCFIRKSKTLLICNLLRTSFFLSFLKRRKINRKLSIHHVFTYVRFPFFLEVNFKTYTICLVRKPVLYEFLFPKFVSSYDYNQLYFVL